MMCYILEAGQTLHDYLRFPLTAFACQARSCLAS